MDLTLIPAIFSSIWCLAVGFTLARAEHQWGRVEQDNLLFELQAQYHKNTMILLEDGHAVDPVTGLTRWELTEELRGITWN